MQLYINYAIILIKNPNYKCILDTTYLKTHFVIRQIKKPIGHILSLDKTQSSFYWPLFRKLIRSVDQILVTVEKMVHCAPQVLYEDMPATGCNAPPHVMSVTRSPADGSKIANDVAQQLAVIILDSEDQKKKSEYEKKVESEQQKCNSISCN